MLARLQHPRNDRCTPITCLPNAHRPWQVLARKAQGLNEVLHLKLMDSSIHQLRMATIQVQVNISRDCPDNGPRIIHRKLNRDIFRNRCIPTVGHILSRSASILDKRLHNSTTNRNQIDSILDRPR